MRGEAGYFAPMQIKSTVSTLSNIKLSYPTMTEVYFSLSHGWIFRVKV